MRLRALLRILALLATATNSQPVHAALHTVTVGLLNFECNSTTHEATLFTPAGTSKFLYEGHIEIPAYVTGNDGETYAVTAIKERTFYNATHITSIILPPTLKVIDATCFGQCTSLQSITLPEGLSSLGAVCFGDCTSLTSVSLPSTLTSVANQAFSRCTRLEQVTLPNGVVSIENLAFALCNMRSVELPSTLENIGSEAFGKCQKLTSLTIPAPLQQLSDEAFKGCSALRNVRIVYSGDNRAAAEEVLATLRTQLPNNTLTATYSCRPVVEWPLTAEQLCVRPGDRLPLASVTPQSCAAAYALMGPNDERTPIAASALDTWRFEGETGQQIVVEAYCPGDNNDRVDALPVRRTFTIAMTLPQLAITWSGTADTPIAVRGGEALPKATVDEGYSVTYSIGGTEIDAAEYHFTARAEEYEVTVVATAPGDGVRSTDAEPVMRTFRVAALAKPTITWSGTADTPIAVRGGEALPKAAVEEGYTVTYSIGGTKIDAAEYHFTARAEEYEVTVVAMAPGDGVRSADAEPVMRTFRVAALAKPTITWVGTADTPIAVRGGEALPKATVDEGYSVTYSIGGTEIDAGGYHFTARAEEYEVTVVATVVNSDIEPVTRTFRVAAVTGPTIIWAGTCDDIIDVRGGDALPRATASEDYEVTYSIDGHEVGADYRFAAQAWAHNVVVVATVEGANGDGCAPMVRTFRVAAASKPTIQWNGTAAEAITVHGGDALPTATVDGGYPVTYWINGQEVGPDYHFAAKEVDYEVVVVATASKSGAEPQTRTFRVEGTDALEILRPVRQPDGVLRSLDGRPVCGTPKPGIYIRNGGLLRVR